jgi:hypothetical protein
MKEEDEMDDDERAWAVFDDAFQSSPAAFEAALAGAAIAEDVTLRSTFLLESLLLPPDLLPDLPPPSYLGGGGGGGGRGGGGAVATAAGPRKGEERGRGGATAGGASKQEVGSKKASRRGGASFKRSRGSCEVCYRRKTQCDGKFPCARYV